MGIESVPQSSSVLASVAYTLGRGVGLLRPAVGVSAVEASAASVRPVAGGAAIGALWGTINGLVNLRRYKRGQISKQQAVRDTASESIGLGVATAIGLTAATVVRTTLLIGSFAALAPFVVASAVTGGAKVLWDRAVRKSGAG